MVTDRDRPIARLVPIEEEDGIELIEHTKPFAEVAKMRFRRTKRDVDSLSLLLAERGTR